jgi:hypothetical protein
VFNGVSQAQMVDLFQTTKQNISLHIRAGRQAIDGWRRG